MLETDVTSLDVFLQAEIFSSVKRPNCFRGLPSFLFIEYRDAFPETKRLEREGSQINPSSV
jgi:hypothetical protein